MVYQNMMQNTCQHLNMQCYYQLTLVLKLFFANADYIYFIEYPTLEKECDTPLEVLESEIKLTKSDAGIIYENINGEFKEIAFLDLKEKNRKM